MTEERKPWITTVDRYHSIAPGRDEYHDGKNGPKPMCHEGGQIKAEHLAEGDGGRSKLCPVCQAERENRTVLTLR
jgi:hypothetical protein